MQAVILRVSQSMMMMMIGKMLIMVMMIAMVEIVVMLVQAKQPVVMVGGGLPCKQTSPNLNSADPLYHHQPHRQPLLHSTFMNFLCNVIGRKCCAIPLKIRSQCNKSHSNHIPAVLVMEKDLNF